MTEVFVGYTSAGYAERIVRRVQLEAVYEKKLATLERMSKDIKHRFNRVKIKDEKMRTRIEYLEDLYYDAIDPDHRHFTLSLCEQHLSMDGLCEEIKNLKEANDELIEFHNRRVGEFNSLRLELLALQDEIALLESPQPQEATTQPAAGPPPCLLSSSEFPPVNSKPTVSVDIAPQHRGSYSQVAAAMDTASPKATAAHSARKSPEVNAANRQGPEVDSTHRQSPEIASTHRPSHEIASTHRPSPEVDSTHRPSPEVDNTHRPSPEVDSTQRPSPPGEGPGCDDGGWSTVKRRKKGKKHRQQPN